MNVLIKTNQYATCMRSEQATAEQVLDLLEHPRVVKSKDSAPLAIWGSMVQDPELDGAQKPRCTGANVESIYCLQLDYDSGMSIDEFCSKYAQYRWTLYTSYSYGFKEGDRFRVIVPLAQALSCHLLNNRRVKNNLLFHWGAVDQCCFDRGHWQLLPCTRSSEAPYRYVKSTGTELWGSWGFDEYERWVLQDAAEEQQRRERARESAQEVDQLQLLTELENELQSLAIGCGSRYAETKRLLAKYAHRGLGEQVLACACPWPSEQKWVRRWDSLIRWGASLDV